MRKQRGIADLRLVVIGSIVILGLISGIVFGVTHYLSGVRAEAKAAGRSECDAAYKGRDNEQLRAALGRVKELEEAAREAERKYGVAIAEIQAKLKKEQANGKDAEERILADVAAGKYRVRGEAFQAGSCPAVSGGSAGSAAGAGATGSDGATACKLSRAAESDILAIGRDANETARILAAAQAVIVQDRITCNGP